MTFTYAEGFDQPAALETRRQSARGEKRIYYSWTPVMPVPETSILPSETFQMMISAFANIPC